MIRNFRLAALLAFMLCAMSLPVFAQEEGGEETADCYAFIAGIVGTMEYQTADAEDKEVWQAAELNMCLDPGDRVRTPAESAGAIKYGEGIEMRLNAGSTVTVTQSEAAENPDSIDLEVGELFADLNKEILGDDASFKVNTPSGVVAVRGTQFNVAVDAEGKSKINVLDGVVAVFNELGEVLAEAGFATELLKDVLPVDPFSFDIDAFKADLDKWKDQISIGAVKEALMEKIDEKKDELKEKLDPRKKLGF